MIRETGRKVIIIAQTAYGLTGDKEKMVASGFDDYLIKPISQNNLLEKLNSFFPEN
jgi:CheY-like chemotaxis protein